MHTLQQTNSTHNTFLARLRAAIRDATEHTEGAYRFGRTAPDMIVLFYAHHGQPKTIGFCHPSHDVAVFPRGSWRAHVELVESLADHDIDVACED